MSTLPVPSQPSKPPAPRRFRLSRGDHEFLPGALEILETPLSPVRSGMIVTICAFAVVALVWAWFGRVDIIATAQGKIQPVGRTKTIQPLEGGKVASVAVEDGARVHAGDVLFTVANLARSLGLDPETCLREANAKFQRRFEAMERTVEATGRGLHEVSLADMEAGWQAAKQAERRNPPPDVAP